jgi:hypothetical protein
VGEREREQNLATEKLFIVPFYYYRSVFLFVREQRESERESFAIVSVLNAKGKRKITK